LEPFILVHPGPTRTFRGHDRPSAGINKWTDCQGPRPLLEVQEATPPGGFKGDAFGLERGAVAQATIRDKRRTQPC